MEQGLRLCPLQAGLSRPYSSRINLVSTRSPGYPARTALIKVVAVPLSPRNYSTFHVRPGLAGPGSSAFRQTLRPRGRPRARFPEGASIGLLSSVTGRVFPLKGGFDATSSGATSRRSTLSYLSRARALPVAPYPFEAQNTTRALAFSLGGIYRDFRDPGVSPLTRDHAGRPHVPMLGLETTRRRPRQLPLGIHSSRGWIRLAPGVPAGGSDTSLRSSPEGSPPAWRPYRTSHRATELRPPSRVIGPGQATLAGLPAACMDGPPRGRKGVTPRLRRVTPASPVMPCHHPAALPRRFGRWEDVL